MNYTMYVITQLCPQHVLRFTAQQHK